MTKKWNQFSDSNTFDFLTTPHCFQLKFCSCHIQHFFSVIIMIFVIVVVIIINSNNIIVIIITMIIIPLSIYCAPTVWPDWTRYWPCTISNPHYQLVFSPLSICSAPIICQVLGQMLGIQYLQHSQQPFECSSSYLFLFSWIRNSGLGRPRNQTRVHRLQNRVHLGSLA